MIVDLPPELAALELQLVAAEEDARALAAVTGEQPEPPGEILGTWNVAECIDHLAITNRVYLGAMEAAALRGRSGQRRRHGPARPGWVGRLFLGSIEPPPGLDSKLKRRFKAPVNIRPRTAPVLCEAVSDFLASQAEVKTFIRTYADLDLAGIRFANPLVPGIRFSLATGLHVIAAHERRHLWQARRVLRELQNRSH